MPKSLISLTKSLKTVVFPYAGGEIITVFLEIGYRHTRFYFGNVLESYLSSIDNDIERQIISREVIKHNPRQSRWIATYINKSKVPKLIESAFNEVA